MILDSNDTLWTCAWSSNGKLLSVSGADKIIRLYSGQDQLQLTNELKGAHSKSIRSVSFCPRRSMLAVASFDGTVSIWTGAKQQDGPLKWTCAATLDGHENEVKAASWGIFLQDQADSEQVFLSTCGRDKTVWVWAMEDEQMDINNEGEDFECLAVLQEHDQDIKCLTWHPNRPLFLTGSYDESILAFGPINPSLDDWICVGKVAKDLKGTVWSLAFSPDGTKLAVALSTGNLIFYTLPQNWNSFTDWIRRDICIFQNIPIEDGIRATITDGEGCCGSNDESSGCCKSKSSELILKSDFEQSDSESGCCSGGTSKMQVDANDSCCSSGSKKPRINPIAIPAVELYSISWNPSGTLLAVACADHSIRIVDLEGSVVVSIEAAHDGEVNCLAWSPLKESNILASVGDDGNLKIWQIIQE